MLHELVRFGLCSATVACIGCAVEPAPPYPPSSGGSGASAGGASAGGASASGGVSAGGASAGGASASGGVSAGGSSAGGVSAGGASGGASAGGASASGGASSGGVSASGGGPQGSFTLSPAQMSFMIDCDFTPQPLTITNTSNVTLNWTMIQPANNISGIFTIPPVGTLLPGQATTVSVIPHPIPAMVLSTSLTFEADVAPSQVLPISEAVTGIFASNLPADIDFGEVPLGTSATAFVPTVNITAGGEILGSGNQDFMLSGSAPTIQPPGFAVGWTLTFTPRADGPQQSTLTYATFGSRVCPPNSLVARGVGTGTAPPPPPFLNFP